MSEERKVIPLPTPWMRKEPYGPATPENVKAATICTECLGSGYEDPWAPDGKLRVCAACHGKGY